MAAPHYGFTGTDDPPVRDSVHWEWPVQALPPPPPPPSSTSTKLRTTTATSASATAGTGTFSGVAGGSETSFQLKSFTDAKVVTPNENFYFDYPIMVASEINESLEMSNNKSLQAQVSLASTAENLSPVLDTQRMGMVCVQNRINNIQRDQDLYSTDLLNNET